MSAPRYRIVGDQFVPIDSDAPSIPIGRVARVGKDGSPVPFAKSEAGRKRQEIGDDTETIVESLHSVCRLQKVAEMRKLPTPYEIWRNPANPKQFLAKHAAKSGVDYVGIMLDGTGRHVAAEAKHCGKARFYFAQVAPHQQAELAIVDRAGGVAVLVVVYGELLHTASIHALPWAFVRSRIEAGAKSLPYQDLHPHRVGRIEPYLARFARHTRSLS